METLAGIREFCETNSRGLRAHWHRVAGLGLQIHIHELENALRNLHGEPLRKKDRLYSDFRNALAELRENCAKFGVHVSDSFRPEDIAQLLR